MAWSDDGKYIVTGSTDCSIIIWDAVTGEQIRTCIGHAGAVQSVCFVGNSKIFSGSSDKSAALWEVSSGKRIQRYLVCMVF